LALAAVAAEPARDSAGARRPGGSVIRRRLQRNSRLPTGAPLPAHGAHQPQPRGVAVVDPVRWCCLAEYSWRGEQGFIGGRWFGDRLLVCCHLPLCLARRLRGDWRRLQCWLLRRWPADQARLPSAFVPTSPDRCARAAGRRSSAWGRCAAGQLPGDLGEEGPRPWSSGRPTIVLGSVERHKPLPPEGSATAAKQQLSADGPGRTWRARCFRRSSPV